MFYHHILHALGCTDQHIFVVKNVEGWKGQ